MTKNWIIQRKIFRGDWETIATFDGTRKEALKRYEHMNGSVRAVSEKQATADNQAGRADRWQRITEPVYPQDFTEMRAELQEIADNYVPRMYRHWDNIIMDSDDANSRNL